MAVIRLVRPAFQGGAFTVGAASAAPQGDGASSEPPKVLITAKSTETETPSAVVVVGAFAVLVIAGIVALVLNDRLTSPLTLAPDMNAFALFYVAAQGIERLLEPLTYFVKPTSSTEEQLDTKKGEALTAAAKDEAMAAATAAADAKAKLARIRSERSIMFWALASVIGIIASGWLGLHFIAMVLAETSRAAVPGWLDVVTTGLVIGGGTKALHDLIGRISKPAEDDSDTAGS